MYMYIYTYEIYERQLEGVAGKVNYPTTERRITRRVAGEEGT